LFGHENPVHFTAQIRRVRTFRRVAANHYENSVSDHVSARTTRDLVRHEREPHSPASVALGCRPDRVTVGGEKVVHVLFRVSGHENVHHTPLSLRRSVLFSELSRRDSASPVDTDALCRVRPGPSSATYPDPAARARSSASSFSFFLTPWSRRSL